MANYGVVTECGDLGLGWMPLDEKDNKIVNEAVARERGEDQTTVINEDQKNK